MLIYLSILVIPSILALNLSLNNPNNNKFNNFFNISWHSFFILVSVIIGFRYQVGADWGTYLKIYNKTSVMTYFDIFKFNSELNDFGYILLNKLSSEIKTGIYGVNFTAALIFLFGIFSFCKRHINPWLSLSLCIPYLIIVVGMGYTRQAISFGIILYAFTFFYENKFFKFTLLVLLASTFHDSAFINILYLMLLISKQYIKKLFLIVFLLLFVALFLFIYFDIHYFILERFDYYYRVYFRHPYNSSGAYFRLIILCVTSIFFLFFILEKINIEENEKKLLTSMSFISIFLFILLFITNSNAVIDRLSIYLYPILITTATLVPQVFNKTKISNISVTIIILLLNILIFAVWFIYGTYSNRWLPYSFIN